MVAWFCFGLVSAPPVNSQEEIVGASIGWNAMPNERAVSDGSGVVQGSLGQKNPGKPEWHSELLAATQLTLDAVVIERLNRASA